MNSLASADLEVYKEYTTDAGYEKNPHTWKVEDVRECNILHNPHVIPEKKFLHLTGVKLLYYWQLVDQQKRKV